MKRSYQKLRDEIKKEINSRLGSGEYWDGKLHIFNNGIFEVKTKLQPEGFVEGRLPFSEETRNKQSISAQKRGPNNKDKKFSDKARKNMSEAKQKFLKENPDWESPTQFKPGQEPWNKGLTKETDERVATMAEHYREARPKGYHYDEETKDRKWNREKETRVANSGSLERSFSNSVDKARATRKKHSGEDPNFNNKIKKKAEESIIKKYGSLEEYYTITINNRNKTILDNYGSFEAYYKILYENQVKTKKKNGSYIGPRSKEEDYLYNELLKIFDYNDIFRWYNDDSRYPWHCDFYIKSLDMFIELQFYWTHGKKPFNEDDLDDINTLNNWLSKRSTYINNKGHKTRNQFYTAIEVWTVSDVLKRNKAKENNLNYIELFNKEDLDDFIRRIQKYGIKK